MSGRPRATWRVWEAIGIYLLALLIGGFASLPVLRLFDDEGMANLAASAVGAVAIIVVLVVWLSLRHPTWRQIMGLPDRGRWWAETRASIGFGLLLYPGMVFGVGLVVSLVLSAIAGEPAQAPEQVPADLSGVGVAVTILYAVIIAPLHEELFFRGVLFRGVRDRYGLGLGLVASGLGFGLIHYLDAPWQDALLLMAVMFFNGIALAWWYERRGTIVAPIVAHMVFNIIGLTLIFTIG
jgi:membrane protease YdiL (CAAX protease family)